MKHLFQIPTDAKTVGETSLKDHYPRINKNMSLVSVMVELRKVVRDIIIPAITKEFYNDLADKYEDDPAQLTAHEKEVLLLLQDAIVEYTVWKLAPSYNITIGDKGIQEVQGSEGTSSAAAAWRYKHFHWNVMVEADRHLDMALAYLDENADEFLAFKANRAKFRLNDFLVRSTAVFEQHVGISDSRRTFKKLIPGMLKANQRYLLPIIGKAFYNELLEELREDELTEENEEALKHIQAVICHGALLESIPALSVLIESEGIFVVSSTDGMNTKQTAHDSRIEHLKDTALKDTNQAIDYLREFLYVNQEDYPTWKDSSVFQSEEDKTGYPYDMKGGIFLG